MKNAVVALVFCLFSIGLIAQVSVNEKEALLDLYSSTNGENWKINWSLDKDVNEWNGVTVEDNKVVGISMLFNNMEGELPSSITQLKYLEVLELSFNKLEGTIPAKLGDLENLKILAFNGNNLSGKIPSSLGNLSNLTQLHLSSNQLSGNLPETIANLNNLEVLNVFDNNLSGKIPSQLAYSRNLRELMVAENSFVETNEFSTLILSSGASIDLNNPFVIPESKRIIAIESEDDN